MLDNVLQVLVTAVRLRDDPRAIRPRRRRHAIRLRAGVGAVGVGGRAPTGTSAISLWAAGLDVRGGGSSGVLSPARGGAMELLCRSGAR